MRTYLHAAVDRVARDLLREGWSEGRRYSAGQNVAQGASHDWVVTTRRGRPVVLAHDAFEAALYLVQLEMGLEYPHKRKTIRLPTDAEAQAERLVERQAWPVFYSLDRWLDRVRLISG